MKLERTVCPYCGAGLQIKYGQRTVKCQYCKSTVLIQDDGDNIVEDSRVEHEPYPPGKEKNPGGTETAPVRRFNHLFPPPGFRTKNPLHIIIAVVGYLLLIVTARGMNTILDAVFFTGMSLSVVDIFTNWTGFFSGFPGVGSQNMLIRILMKIVWSLVVAIAWALILVSIEMIFGM